MPVVEFTDSTINETNGDYEATAKIMSEDGARDWMLRSEAFVETDAISCNFLLHFWDGGDVYIMETEHPCNFEAPDDDIRALSAWCQDNGWKTLYAHDDLVSDPISMDFWSRIRSAGIVDNKEIRKIEQETEARLKKAEKKDAPKTEDKPADI
jgi:hypothetical protein